MLIFSLILVQILIFVGLIVMLRRILTQNVSSAITHLDELNQDYAKKNIEVDKQLEEAKQKSQELLVKSREEADALKAQIIKEAEEERDKIVKQARSQSEDIMQQAERSRQLLISEIEKRIAKEAINKACELIERVLPEEFKQDVHSHWVAELIVKGFNQLETLNIPSDIEEAKISAAFPLTAEQRKGLLKKLRDILGKDIKVTEEVDPSVVAGLIITIGSLVLDGSLKNRIKEQTKDTSYAGS